MVVLFVVASVSDVLEVKKETVQPSVLPSLFPTSDTATTSANSCAASDNLFTVSTAILMLVFVMIIGEVNLHISKVIV